MPLSTRAVKTRISSISNTKKITKAMEMISAVKMRKATSATTASRDYSRDAWKMISGLAQKLDATHHPFFDKTRKVNRLAIIIISSNRGLCGSFNEQLMSKIFSYIEEKKKDSPDLIVDWIAMGKKGAEYLARHKQNIIAQFEKTDVAENSSVIIPLSQMVANDFISGRYDKVILAYTDYVSALKQLPQIQELLPITEIADHGYLGAKADNDQNDKKESHLVKDLIFEPNAETLLNYFLPRLIEIQIFQALLETNASEHSARMMAMKNASEAAEEMIDDLKLTFNQLRQSAITQEIAEISSGRIALGA